MTTILITGGTGLVGQQLSKQLLQKGFIVKILTRTPKKNNEFSWDVSKQHIDLAAFENLDYIVHLAGAGIADERWSKKRKKEIIDSRVLSTNLLFEKIKTHSIQLKGFVSASAIGYYGAINSNAIFTETDPPATDFIGNVCKLWEAAALQFETLKIPTTILRTGIVLSNTGGALSKMNTPIITPIASGKQYIPWIHIKDLVSMFVKAIEDKNIMGIYNAVAPCEETSFSFSKKLATATKKRFIPIGVPSFLLKLLFGEMKIILTTGSRVSSKKIEKTGFVFAFKNLENAFTNIFNKSMNTHALNSNASSS